METIRHELIDCDNNIYEVFLTPEEYAKAAFGKKDICSYL